MASFMHCADTVNMNTKENGPANVIKQQKLAGKNSNSSRMPFGRINKNSVQKGFASGKSNGQRGVRKALGSIKNLQNVGNARNNIRAAAAKQGGKLAAKENVENVEAYPTHIAKGLSYRACDMHVSASKFLNNLGQGVHLKNQVVDVDEASDSSANTFSAAQGFEDTADFELFSSSDRSKDVKEKSGILGSLISDLNSDLSDLSSDEDD